jgi:hypothetical protein
MLDRALFDFIAQILNGPTGRQWYADGQPIWKQGRKESPRRAASRREGNAASSRRSYAVTAKATPPHCDWLIPSKIVLKNHRCLSGACPECARALQRWFVSAASAVVLRKRHWHVVSLVWREHRFSEGKLDSDTMFERLRRHLQIALKAAGKIRSSLAASCLDPRRNEESKETSDTSQDEISREQEGQTTVENCPLRWVADRTGLCIEDRLSTSCISSTKKEKRLDYESTQHAQSTLTLHAEG